MNEENVKNNLSKLLGLISDGDEPLFQDGFLLLALMLYSDVVTSKVAFRYVEASRLTGISLTKIIFESFEPVEFQKELRATLLLVRLGLVQSKIATILLRNAHNHRESVLTTFQKSPNYRHFVEGMSVLVTNSKLQKNIFLSDSVVNNAFDWQLERTSLDTYPNSEFHFRLASHFNIAKAELVFVKEMIVQIDEKRMGYSAAVDLIQAWSNIRRKNFHKFYDKGTMQILDACKVIESEELAAIHFSIHSETKLTNQILLQRLFLSEDLLRVVTKIANQNIYIGAAILDNLRNSPKTISESMGLLSQNEIKLQQAGIEIKDSYESIRTSHTPPEQPLPPGPVYPPANPPICYAPAEESTPAVIFQGAASSDASAAPKEVATSAPFTSPATSPSQIPPQTQLPPLPQLPPEPLIPAPAPSPVPVPPPAPAPSPLPVPPPAPVPPPPPAPITAPNLPASDQTAAESADVSPEKEELKGWGMLSSNPPAEMPPSTDGLTHQHPPLASATVSPEVPETHDLSILRDLFTESTEESKKPSYETNDIDMEEMSAPAACGPSQQDNEPSEIQVHKDPYADIDFGASPEELGLETTSEPISTQTTLLESLDQPFTPTRAVNGWLGHSGGQLPFETASVVYFNISETRINGFVTALFSEPIWNTEQDIELIFALSSQQALINPEFQSVVLPKSGDSSKAEFHVTPKVLGKVSLILSIYFAKNLALLERLETNIEAVPQEVPA